MPLFIWAQPLCINIMPTATAIETYTHIQTFRNIPTNTYSIYVVYTLGVIKICAPVFREFLSLIIQTLQVGGVSKSSDPLDDGRFLKLMHPMLRYSRKTSAQILMTPKVYSYVSYYIVTHCSWRSKFSHHHVWAKGDICLTYNIFSRSRMNNFRPSIPARCLCGERRNSIFQGK